MIRVIYVMPDHSVQVFQPAETSRQEDEDLNAWLERVANKSRPAEAVATYSVDDASLPTDNRDAWVWNGSKVVIDPSRIRPPEMVQEAIAALPVARGESPDWSAEIARQVQAAKTDIVNSVLRYEYEKAYAYNALREDQFVPEGQQRDEREICRRRLAEIGAPHNKTWLEVANEIISRSNYDADALVRPS